MAVVAAAAGAGARDAAVPVPARRPTAPEAAPGIPVKSRQVLLLPPYGRDGHAILAYVSLSVFIGIPTLAAVHGKLRGEGRGDGPGSVPPNSGEIAQRREKPAWSESGREIWKRELAQHEGFLSPEALHYGAERCRITVWAEELGIGFNSRVQQASTCLARIG